MLNVWVFIYITDDDMAGHYVPQLAEAIFDHNKYVPEKFYINLKGFMVSSHAWEFLT